MDTSAIKARLGSVPKNWVAERKSVVALIEKDVPAMLAEIEELQGMLKQYEESKPDKQSMIHAASLLSRMGHQSIADWIRRSGGLK